jgi:hypothetical protein
MYCGSKAAKSESVSAIAAPATVASSAAPALLSWRRRRRRRQRAEETARRTVTAPPQRKRFFDSYLGKFLQTFSEILTLPNLQCGQWRAAKFPSSLRNRPEKKTTKTYLSLRMCRRLRASCAHRGALLPRLRPRIGFCGYSRFSRISQLLAPQIRSARRVQRAARLAQRALPSRLQAQQAWRSASRLR